LRKILFSFLRISNFLHLSYECQLCGISGPHGAEVNFINIPRTAFACADPKSAKNTDNLIVFLHFQDQSAHILLVECWWNWRQKKIIKKIPPNSKQLKHSLMHKHIADKETKTYTLSLSHTLRLSTTHFSLCLTFPSIVSLCVSLSVCFFLFLSVSTSFSLYISVAFSLSLFLSVSTSFSLYIYVAFSLSLFLSVSTSFSLYISVAFSLSLFLSVSTSFYLYISVAFSLSLFLSVSTSFYLVPSLSLSFVWYLTQPLSLSFFRCTATILFCIFFSPTYCFLLSLYENPIRRIESHQYLLLKPHPIIFSQLQTNLINVFIKIFTLRGPLVFTRSWW